MEAPKCKLCGDRHYGLCPKFDRGPAKERAEKAVAKRSAEMLKPKDKGRGKRG